MSQLEIPSRKRNWLLAVRRLAAVLAMPLPLLASAQSTTPLLRVPKVTRPPVVDGVLDTDEYREFAAVTGMVHWKPQRLIPAVQQVVWYLGYDDENLYIAMDSPTPEGTWPVARLRPADALERSIDRAILYDDHVELQFGTYGRGKSSMGGYGFYKIIANARAAVSDVHWYNGTPGSEELWEFGGEIACKVTDNAWRMELSVPLRAIGIDRPEGPDGFRMPVQLVRADSSGGAYFAGWVGATWMEWERFGEIILDPEAPPLQFIRTGELARGEMDLGFEVANLGAGPIAVVMRIQATDGDGRQLLDERRQLKLSPNERGAIDFSQSLAWTPEGNRVDVQAVMTTEGGREREIYRAELPVIHLTDDYFNIHVQPWLARKPRTGEYNWRCAYWPSYDIVRGTLDLDLFGLKEDIRDAAAWAMTLRPKGDGKIIAEARAPIVERSGEMVLECGSLEAGEYEVDLRLYDAENRVVDRRTTAFTRENYPWEGNQIGLQDRLIPPYTPIVREGMVLRPWGRRVEIGASGLPQSIEAEGGRRGIEALLRAPIRLEAEDAGGKIMVFEGGNAEIETATDTHAIIKAGGELAGARIQLDGTFEYDGWYQVRLSLAPGETQTQLQRLTLVLPLWCGADTMYVQRGGDSIARNRMGAIPDGEGKVWDSRQLLRFGREWGSFVPVVFAGNGDKGLWWIADENRDWTLSDDLATVEFVRVNNGVDVRIHLLAAETDIDRIRQFEFALLASPVKPFPSDYRRRVWSGDTEYFGHSTHGYRYYGHSVNGFEIYDDNDYAALTRYLHESGFSYAALVREGKPMVLYGSTWMCGLGLDAFDTYGGEWLGQSDWSPRPETAMKGRKNLQGTRTFETPREHSPVAVNWTESFSDCFVWWHERLLERCPVNGTWWDNASIGLIRDYDPERREFYSRFNTVTRRRLTKRLATMGWEIGREPLWIMNMHADFSFTQYAWHVENDFFPLSPEGDVMDVLDVDTFRALTRTKHGILPQLDSKMVWGTLTRQQQVHQARVAFGLCLLHDIGARSLHNPQAHVYHALLQKIEEHVNLFDGAEFIPYWDNADLATLAAIDAQGNPVPDEAAHLRASLYRDRDRALIVVMNVTGEPGAFPRFMLDNSLFPDKRASVVRDIENGTTWRMTQGHWYAPNERSLRIERHGLMLLAVE